MQTYNWINLDKARYYTITVQKKSALKQIVLSHAWGGCYSNRGGRKSIKVESEEQVDTYIAKMFKRRKSRGYELLAPINAMG